MQKVIVLIVTSIIMPFFIYRVYSVYTVAIPYTPKGMLKPVRTQFILLEVFVLFCHEICYKVCISLD